MAKVDEPVSTKDFVERYFLVADDIALEIRRIIARSHTDAIRKWNEVVPDLVHSAIDRLTINNLLNGQHISSAIITTLEIWCSSQGKNSTFTSLTKVFREHQLNALADELEEDTDRLSGFSTTLTMDRLHLQEDSPILFGMKDCIQDVYFFKRPSTMKQLCEVVTKSYTQKHGSRLNLITAVTGPSEIGKTALVRKFISEQLSQNGNFPKNVIWFNAKGIQSLRTSLGSFLQLYLKLDPPQRSSTNSEIKGALRTIYEWLSIRKVLIVFDGADRIVLDIITESLGTLKFVANRSCSVPSIIIATQLQNVTAQNQEIKLWTPDMEEISHFLDERVEVGSQFKSEFQQLPMGLLQIFQLSYGDWKRVLLPIYTLGFIPHGKFDAGDAQTSLPLLRIMAYMKYDRDDSISKNFLKFFSSSNQEEFSRLVLYLLALTPVQESTRTTSLIMPHATRLCIRSNLEKDVELRILSSMMQTFEQIPVEENTYLEVIEQTIHFILFIVEQNIQIYETRKVQLLSKLLTRAENSKCFHQSGVRMDFIFGELRFWGDTVCPTFTQSIKDRLADGAIILNAERLVQAANKQELK